MLCHCLRQVAWSFLSKCKMNSQSLARIKEPQPGGGRSNTKNTQHHTASPSVAEAERGLSRIPRTACVCLFQSHRKLRLLLQGAVNLHVLQTGFLGSGVLYSSC